MHISTMMSKSNRTNLDDEGLNITISSSSSSSFSTELLSDSDISESDMSGSGDIIGGGVEGVSPKDKLSLEIYMNS